MMSQCVSLVKCEHLFFMTKKFIIRKIIGKNQMKEKRTKIIRKRKKKKVKRKKK